MVKLYQLYIASNLIVPFMVSSVFFVCFLLTFELFRIMQFLTARDVTIGFLGSLMGNMGITLLPMAIPLSIYFSTIYCMAKLSGDSEYIAMRAMGVPKRKLILPFILIGALTSANLYFMGQEVVPGAHREVRRMIKKISSSSLIEGIKSGQYFTAIDNITMFPLKVDEVTRELEQVLLHISLPGQQMERTITAKRGKIIYEKSEDTGLESFKLLLNDGNMISRKMGALDVDKILFQEYLLPISEKRFSYETVTREIMMNKRELNQFIDDGLEAALAKDYKKKDYFNATYEYWNRLNTPFLAFILTFLGFCLGVKGTRGLGKNSNARAILVLITYYILYFAMISTCRDNNIPVLAGLILPNLGMIFFTFKQYKELDWQG